MEIVKVGFIGCGGNASGHIGRVLGMGDTEVVALCDVSEQSLKRVKDQHQGVADLPTFRDYKEMLENEKDLDDVPKETRKKLKFVLVDRVEEVFAEALVAKSKLQ